MQVYDGCNCGSDPRRKRARAGFSNYADGGSFDPAGMALLGTSAGGVAYSPLRQIAVSVGAGVSIFLITRFLDNLFKGSRR